MTEICRGHNPSQRNQSLEEDYIEQGPAVTRSAILKLEFFESGLKLILHNYKTNKTKPKKTKRDTQNKI